jgi:hypothetical protein
MDPHKRTSMVYSKDTMVLIESNNEWTTAYNNEYAVLLHSLKCSAKPLSNFAYQQTLYAIGFGHKKLLYDLLKLTGNLVRS